MTFISRRDLLKRVGMTAVAVPMTTGVARGFQPRERGAPPHGADTAPWGPRTERAALQQRDVPENLSAEEADILDAVVARLIPTDELGPGATEARAVRYIDRALGGALSASRQAYTAGLAALDRYARSSRGASFARLSASDQDSVLVDVEAGTASGFTSSSAAFFSMVLNHTHQGTFGDPYYGGNANLIGWDLIRYPGVRTMVSASDQKQLEANRLQTNHKSAYDYEFERSPK